MITRIQGNVSNTIIQAKNNQPQQTKYITKTNNLKDSISFGGKTSFSLNPRKYEKMTEATSKAVKMVADSLAEKKKLVLEAISVQKEHFDEEQKELELGVRIKILKDADPFIYLSKKNVDGNDVNFYSDTRADNFSDHSLFSFKNEMFNQKIYIKGNEIGVFDNSCKGMSLNEEAQKLLKLFLPKEGK